MSDFLLDTDVVVDLFRGHPDTADVIRRLAPGSFAISVVTIGELVHGVELAAQPDREQHKLNQFLALTPALLFDHETAQLFGQIRGRLQKAGMLVPDLDLMIGATAVQHGLVLITRNRGHFDRIPSLRLRAVTS
jgi:tRNA(fMet)-specific endonuclease VapC